MVSTGYELLVKGANRAAKSTEAAVEKGGQKSRSFRWRNGFSRSYPKRSTWNGQGSRPFGAPVLHTPMELQWTEKLTLLMRFGVCVRVCTIEFDGHLTVDIILWFSLIYHLLFLLLFSSSSLFSFPVDQFRSDGQRIAGSACDYQFISQAGSGTDGRPVGRRGKFYSPLYPSLYPPRSRCFYHFYGRLV